MVIVFKRGGRVSWKKGKSISQIAFPVRPFVADQARPNDWPGQRRP